MTHLGLPLLTDFLDLLVECGRGSLQTKNMIKTQNENGGGPKDQRRTSEDQNPADEHWIKDKCV